MSADQNKLEHKLFAPEEMTSNAVRHEHDPLIVCDSCAGLVCVKCGHCLDCEVGLPVDNNVLLLPNASIDTFYEGAYTAQIHLDESSLSQLSGKLLVPFVNYGYLKKVLDSVKPGSRVLELGCGGGMKIAGERFAVTALDLSLASLQQVPANYRHRIHADVLKVDFSPASFDAVVASCFFEHFKPEDQRELLTKIHNWLKPGGSVIFLFDTESANPGFKWLRRHATLYQQCFIDHDGHVGLQPVSNNRLLFRECGFVECEGIGLNRTIQHLPVYTWMAPYSSVSKFAGIVSTLGSWIAGGVFRARSFTALVHLWDVSFGRLLPLDWSRLYLGVWTRQ
jgi:SAM-dependent methyltransferase